MKFQYIRRPMLLLASTSILALAVNGQNTVSEVVTPSSVPDGFYRPHSWVASSINPDATVRGPGQTACGPSTNLCYYFPTDIRTAYATAFIANGNGGQGMTVGIVDAYYNPQTEADLAAFNTQFALPACTIANGCLTIVSQTGGAPTAGFNVGWAQETNLDVQWVHAIAPNAKILLVTATTPSFTNMNTAVTYAAAHSNVVSNSYGANEFGAQTTLDPVFAAATVPLLFSSGDTGAVVSYPCSSPTVTCIGGTNLLETATAFRNVEAAWTGSGGGCSAFESSVAYQTGFSTCGAARGVPDISALADPYTGAIVFLGTNAGSGSPGFYVFGGTSLACPIASAVVAIVDTARAAAGKSPLGGNLNTKLYPAAAAPFYRYRYYDVTMGTSGFPATPGWDKATGLGVGLSPSLANYLVSLP